MEAVKDPHPGTAGIAQRVLGVALALLGMAALLTYPVGGLWLSVLGAALATAQWRDERAWLIALPIALACIDLGAWSGRLLLDELDGLLAVLAGTALAAGQFVGGGAQMARRSSIPFWFLVLALIIGVWRGLWPLANLDSNAWSGYLTSWNAMRVGRGEIWALLFAPLLTTQLNRDRAATQERLALGLTFALLGFGTYVLWERGLLIDLFTAQDRWGLGATWLDLAGNYRITGTFSQMHLGGEAVDAFLTLAWPFALWLLLQTKRWPLMLLASGALGLAAYAVMVTFTRTTYLVIGISVVSFLVAFLARPGTLGGRRLATVTGFVAVCAGLCLLGYSFGGALLLLGYLAVLLGGLAAGLFRHRLPQGAALMAGLALWLGAGLALAVRAMLTSKWSDNSLSQALAIALPSVLILGLAGLAVGRMLHRHVDGRAAGVFLVCLTLGLPAATIALSGTHIRQRASTAGLDLQVRVAHWEKGLSLLSNDWLSRFLGRGLGSFPLVNLLEGRPDSDGSNADGIWFFIEEDRSRMLRMLGGGTSLCIGQRLNSPQPGKYTVTVWVRNPSVAPATLVVKLQQRRLLEMEPWQPHTGEVNWPVKPGKSFQQVSGTLELDASRLPAWYDPKHLVFVLTNQGANDSALDFAGVQLIGPDGRELLANGHFAAGGDHWLAYNDFHHLGWHLKSIYVALYFEMGLLGVVAFVFLAGLALLRSFDQARHGQTFGAALVAAVTGFLVLGLTGTLLDVPRVMTLFLLLVITAVWRQRVRRRPNGPDLHHQGSPGDS